ncbi:MAG: pyrroline-5-carboxylate reductase [Corynebacterium sp.]|nr:pyrroline-5-carboxylate reductase [Corynebacterium sp.]
MAKIAIIGGGKIGEALISGLIAAEVVDPKNLWVANHRQARSDELEERYGVNTTLEAGIAVEMADLVFICVKPYAVTDVLATISPIIEDNAQDTVIISVAAGLELKTLEAAVPLGTPLIRVMPNTPMLVRKGVSAVARGRFVTDEQAAEVVELLSAIGVALEVKEEQMSAVTALSGSSPAYYFLVLEAMIDSGIKLGLPYEVAKTLATESMAGAAQMVSETGVSPAELRVGVQSPGGTTIAAVEALENAGLRAAFFKATEACARRAEELK